MLFADVIVDISHEKVDRSFQYRIPEELAEKVEIGASVLIPFGRGNKTRSGYVVGISKEPKVDPEKLKDLAGISEKALTAENRSIALAGWMRHEYGGTMIAALKTALPVKRAVAKREPKKNPYAGLEESGERITLNKEQKDAVERFRGDYKNNKRGTYLLYGVTGSGKTACYMEMMETVIAEKKAVIVLIPEIALTYQTLSRFFTRFGKKVGVMHSRLSAGEKYREWEKAKMGEISVMIGPRSALFAPFSDIGLIVIDEEHESAYKSEQVPKYHARDVARKLAAMTDASVVLGSATPSLESWKRAGEGEYTLLSLKKRVEDRPLAPCTVVDMGKELKRGNRSILSRPLSEAMKKRLSAGEQVMLFLNRRGLSGFVSCRACGHVLKCPHCDVSLSLHTGGRMKCHYCGYETAALTVCPSCGSKVIGAFKAGTQSVERVVKSAFPEARILRMDADTTKGKDGHERILAQFAKGGADILIGTQMIVKGHDFASVGLVGILAADLSLNTADFLGSERTFELLVQAAGRAGRGEKPGEVIIQTYQPDHYAIRTAAAQDYTAFYTEESAYRRLLSYPPFAHMLCIQIFSGREDEAKGLAELLARSIKKSGRPVSMAGPAPARIAKTHDTFRFAIYLKSKDRGILTDMKEKTEEWMKTRRKYRSVSVFFDFDPMGSF